MVDQLMKAEEDHPGYQNNSTPPPLPLEFATGALQLQTECNHQQSHSRIEFRISQCIQRGTAMIHKSATDRRSKLSSLANIRTTNI
eukprot:4220294-Amphidinium_carterae.1